MSRNRLGNRKKIECIEWKRLEIVYDDIRQLVYTLRSLIPYDIWYSYLRQLNRAETHQDIFRLEREAINSIVEANLPNTVTSPYENDRAPCPLCGSRRQDGQGFSLPIGLERHLQGYGNSPQCGVLRAEVRFLHMQINELQGSRFYLPFIDADNTP